MRYYQREHLQAYARIRAGGLSQWSELHEPRDGFEDFPNREFLAEVLPEVLPEVGVAPAPSVLEYGCGTGPAACFLAARGYRVHGIDLVPDAIEIARRQAADRGLDVRFEVADVCDWGDPNELYDIVVDSFCLQSIVLDADRRAVLDGVRRRLRPSGRYVVSTAVRTPDRDYGADRYDPDTGIVWARIDGPAGDAVRLDGVWYLPHRRHLSGEALAAELSTAGFAVVRQSSSGGDVVCTSERRATRRIHG